jgi:hypothetical protein
MAGAVRRTTVMMESFWVQCIPPAIIDRLEKPSRCRSAREALLAQKR